jgi:hypothetical protein
MLAISADSFRPRINTVNFNQATYRNDWRRFTLSHFNGKGLG